MTFDERQHRPLALWAADCAEHVLVYFEERHPDDTRPRDAIEDARAWVRGELAVTAAREAAFTAHAAERAAGHAAATAHVATHAPAPGALPGSPAKARSVIGSAPPIPHVRPGGQRPSRPPPTSSTPLIVPVTGSRTGSSTLPPWSSPPWSPPSPVSLSPVSLPPGLVVSGC